MSYFNEVETRFNPSYWWQVTDDNNTLQDVGVSKTGADFTNLDLPLLGSNVAGPEDSTGSTPIESETTSSIATWTDAFLDTDIFRTENGMSGPFSQVKYQTCFYNIWVNVTDLVVGDSRTIFSMGNQGGALRSGTVDLTCYSDDGLTYFVRGEIWRDRGIVAGARLISEATLLPDQWYMVTLVQDGSGLKLYINGQDVTSASTPEIVGDGLLTDSFYTVGVESVKSILPITLGSRKSDSSPSQSLFDNGSVTDFSLGAGAPSAADILAVYESRLAPVEPPVESTRNIWAGDDVSADQGSCLGLGMLGVTYVSCGGSPDLRTFSEAVVDLSPLTYHKLDEAIGATTLIDTMGNVNVNVGIEPPIYEQSILLTGAPTGIQMPIAAIPEDAVISTGNTTPQTLGDFSVISAVTTSAVVSARQAIIQTSIDSELEEGNNTWSLYVDAGGILTMFWEYGIGINETVSGPSLPLGAEVFVAAVRDTTTKVVSFYVNGVQTDVAYANNPTGGSSTRFMIGSWASGANLYEGIISDTATFHKKLTSSEISTLWAKVV